MVDKTKRPEWNPQPRHVHPKAASWPIAYEFARAWDALLPADKEALRAEVMTFVEFYTACSKDMRESLQLSLSTKQRIERVALWNFLQHGDGKHQSWLLEAIHAFYDGTPRPEPK